MNYITKFIRNQVFIHNIDYKYIILPGNRFMTDLKYFYIIGDMHKLIKSKSDK
jgi:hypothetical protein